VKGKKEGWGRKLTLKLRREEGYFSAQWGYFSRVQPYLP